MAAGVALGAAAALPVGEGARHLCCVPFVGSPTPEVLADGLLHSTIDWSSLIKDAPRCASQLSGRAGLENITWLAAEAAAPVDAAFAAAEAAAPVDAGVDAAASAEAAAPVGH